MKEKDLAKVTAMKSQTFGVEVEMYNISRGRAVEVVADYFGTRGSVRHIGDAYDTWLCKDAQGRGWKFENDSSIQHRVRCELVTPILKYEDLETLQEVLRRLRKAGAKSDPSHSCGVHIHVGLQDHTAKTLRNLANLMSAHENLLIHAIRIARNRTDRWCQTVDRRFLDRLNREKPTTMQALSDVWYESHFADHSRRAHYNPSRYHMLNLHASFTKGTIEFRLFQFDNPTRDRKGGLHAGQIKSYVQLCLAMSQAAKDLKTCSPKQPQVENEKFAMRTWLVRLGFIGDEFKTARDLLTRNLDGDLAWRHGRPAPRAAEAAVEALEAPTYTDPGEPVVFAPDELLFTPDELEFLPNFAAAAAC